MTPQHTNQVSICGTVKGQTVDSLADYMECFLLDYLGQNQRFKIVRYNDGDNVDVEFNAFDGFEINFQGTDNGFLVYAFNNNSDTGAVKILKDILTFFNSKSILYNIEVQYEYDNGEWRDEDFFVHPGFK